MDFYIITLFPESLDSYIQSSIIGRAASVGLIRIHYINPREFADDAHKTADDKPFGGGPGMVLKTLPLLKAVESIPAAIRSHAKIILFSPSGKQFSQKTARNFAQRYRALILICGRYEGVDERVRKILKAEEISIGPYVLTGGELPALAVLDITARHIPGVLGKTESLEENHGSYPVYTRPEMLEWKGKKYRVPKILMSGDHAKIDAWREKHFRDSF